MWLISKFVICLFSSLLTHFPPPPLPAQSKLTVSQRIEDNATVNYPLLQGSFAFLVPGWLQFVLLKPGSADRAGPFPWQEERRGRVATPQCVVVGSIPSCSWPWPTSPPGVHKCSFLRGKEQRGEHYSHPPGVALPYWCSVSSLEENHCCCVLLPFLSAVVHPAVCSLFGLCMWSLGSLRLCIST